MLYITLHTSLAETSLNNIKIFVTLKRFHFYLEPFHHAIKESNNVLFIEPLVKRFYMESFFFYNRTISSICVFMTWPELFDALSPYFRLSLFCCHGYYKLPLHNYRLNLWLANVQTQTQPSLFFSHTYSLPCTLRSLLKGFCSTLVYV